MTFFDAALHCHKHCQKEWFFDDFASFMESIILTPEPLIIKGDFNIHVNNTNDSDACEF